MKLAMANLTLQTTGLMALGMVPQSLWTQKASC